MGNRKTLLRRSADGLAVKPGYQPRRSFQQLKDLMLRIEISQIKCLGKRVEAADELHCLPPCVELFVRSSHTLAPV